MMAPPRFQCLNAVKRASKPSSSLRAAFSTSQSIKADDSAPPTRRPQQPSATASLLSAITPASPSTTSRTPYQHPGTPTPFTNPIKDQTPISSSLSSPTSSSSTTERSKTQRVLNVLERTTTRNTRAREREAQLTSADVGLQINATALGRNITRRFTAGDVYAPHDLHEIEMRKWKQRKAPSMDVFDMLDFNPLDSYKNFSIMGEFMTPMGRIMHSKTTGLRAVNQRKIAKAIRRSIGLGLMPSVHRHPEALLSQRSRQQNGAFRSAANTATTY